MTILKGFMVPVVMVAFLSCGTLNRVGTEKATVRDAIVVHLELLDATTLRTRARATNTSGQFTVIGDNDWFEIATYSRVDSALGPDLGIVGTPDPTRREETVRLAPGESLAREGMIKGVPRGTWNISIVVCGPGFDQGSDCASSNKVQVTVTEDANTSSPLTLGDEVIVLDSAPSSCRPGAYAKLVARFDIETEEVATKFGVPRGTPMMQVEFGDGTDCTLPESMVLKVEQRSGEE